MLKLKASSIKLVIAFSGWWLLWIAIQTMVLHHLGNSWQISAYDALVTQATLALAGYIISTTLRFYQPRKILKYVVTWSITMAVLSAYLQQWLLIRVATQDYLVVTHHTLLLRGTFDWLMILFITLTSWLWFFVLDQKQNDSVKENAERLAREAELATLRMQLQPHFLFNSLNSISALVVIDPEQARNMIQQLSDFLRGTVKKDDRQQVSLEEELEHLQLYLDIEKIRFGYRLNTVINADSESLKAKLPSLLLQPVVENAIKFGLYDTIGDITISITAKTENKYLSIEIKNPYDPVTAQPLQGTGFGLNSVRRRLYLLYSQNDLLATTQENSIFTTLIKIPQFQ